MSSKIVTKTWPFLAIIAAHIIWGTNFVVAKLTLQEIPPYSLAFLRFAIAFVLLAPFLFSERKLMQVHKADLPKIFLVGVLMTTLNISFFYNGLIKTTVISAATITMIIPLLSVLIGWTILKEKVYVVNVLGIILGLLGAVLIIGIPLTILGESITTQGLIGNLLIVFSSIFWVAGAVIAKQVLNKYSTLSITAFIFAVGLISFFIPAVNEYLQSPSWPSHLSLLGIMGLLYIATASSISAYFLFEWGLKEVGIITADLFQYIEPLIATVLAVLILGEQLRLYFIIGAILTGLGVYWGTLAKLAHKHPKAHRT